MECPKCTLPMNFQANKTNEKAPDWKCSDSNCKWQLKKGQWVQSDFITAKWDNEGESPNLAPKPTNLTPPAPTLGRDFYAEAFGKCKHAFLVEAFKKEFKDIPMVDIDFSEIEKVSEQWAKMSMRILKKPQVKTLGGQEQVDQDAFDSPPEDVTPLNY